MDRKHSTTVQHTMCTFSITLFSLKGKNMSGTITNDDDKKKKKRGYIKLKWRGVNKKHMKNDYALTRIGQLSSVNLRFYSIMCIIANNLQKSGASDAHLCQAAASPLPIYTQKFYCFLL
jgi:hypothetical protein